MPGPSRSRILIADDHALIAEALSKLLTIDFDVIACVHDGRRLVQTALALKPDVVLIDIGMPLLNGLQAAQRIKRILPSMRFICVTVNQDPDLVAEAFQCGASGYLPKTSAGTELVAAVHAVLRGEIYISPALLKNRDDLDDRVVELGKAALTERQLEVLQLLAEGKSMKEVAAVLDLTTRTVAFHKYRLMHNLHLKNDAEVVQYAIRQRIIFD